MAADGSAANRLAQAGKRIAGGLTIVFLAASGAVYVLCGEALVCHHLASASVWRWSAARPA